MGGIGKTTMVRVVYERISREFEFSFLLTDVRDSVEKKGLLNLQKQLLSGIWTKKADISDLHEGATIIRRLLGHKKVLLILDDVTHSSHLKYLAGNQKWFGSGSRVLITTRNEHLLIKHGVERRLKVEEFDGEDSLQLFSWKAFKKGYPEEDFVDLSKSVINYAKGLPLALEVLGSFLHGRDLSEWNSALRKLGRVYNLEIFDILKTSYDDLDDEEKKIFLDISCFFCGENQDRVTKILISCDVSAIIGIKVLIERSLLTVLHGRLWMHDLLQQMGREIVRRESTNEPGRRSRLWQPEDIKHVLTNNTGTEAIEGIILDSTELGVTVRVNAKSFLMMNRLRYLVIKNGNLPNGLECLPNSLRILNWTGYPLKSLPSHFNPEKLLELEMFCSCIEHFPLEIEPLYNLKTIKLSGSLNLINTPNFNGMPHLEVLFLEGCTRLYEVDPGVEGLEKLTMLSLKDCKNLVHFASSVRGLKSLEVVNLSGCSKLRKLPNDIGHLESLVEVDVSGTSIRELPCSIGMLERLVSMSLRDCKHLVCLPSSVRGLKSLKDLNLSGCSKLDRLPDELGHIACLEEVDASGTSIRELPCSIGMLELLVSMSLRDCKNLVCLPSSVGGLKSLKDLNLSGCSKLDKLSDELGLVACLEKLDVSGSGIREVPSSIGLLKNLKKLFLGGCKGQSHKSWNMMFNPFQLLRKRSHIPARLVLPSLSGLHSLTKLDLSDCNLSEIPNDLGCLSLLRELDLSKNQFVRLPESIRQLFRLECLHLDSCCKLQSLPELPTCSCVNINNCISLDTLTNQIEKLMSVNCFKMVDNESCKSSALSLLIRYLKFQHWGSSAHSKPHFSFTAPGNEIPEWYNHQSVGSSITVELHPGWFSNKWKGFAWCVVFRLLKPLPPLAEFGLRCLLTANGESLGRCYIGFGGKWGIPVLDHIWFFCGHRDKYSFKPGWQDVYYQLQLEFSFISHFHMEGGMDEEIGQVKKCGVRTVYEEDAASSCTEIGAGQEEEEEPHPKRFKGLELDEAGPSDQKSG
ncbi:disease resistance protein RUN1-like isoform X2 [Rosa rugosa]|nr:disease resistance protein RUN1-like isoform X2 [Rosa rugosa]